MDIKNLKRKNCKLIKVLFITIFITDLFNIFANKNNCSNLIIDLLNVIIFFISIYIYIYISIRKPN